MYNKKAMKELKKLLIKKYPELIEKIILFGSRVENKENKYSDYDILVILKKTSDWKIKKKIKYTSFDISLDFDILTDMNFISKNEINGMKGELPFIQDALSKGVVI